MIKIDKSKYPVFYNLLSQSGKVYHVFCVSDFESLDISIDVSFSETSKNVNSKNLFQIIDSSSYKFVFFYRNFVIYFAEVPTSATLQKVRKELEL